MLDALLSLTFQQVFITIGHVIENGGVREARKKLCRRFFSFVELLTRWKLVAPDARRTARRENETSWARSVLTFSRITHERAEGTKTSENWKICVNISLASSNHMKHFSSPSTEHEAGVRRKRQKKGCERYKWKFVLGNLNCRSERLEVFN